MNGQNNRQKDRLLLTQEEAASLLLLKPLLRAITTSCSEPLPVTALPDGRGPRRCRTTMRSPGSSGYNMPICSRCQAARANDLQSRVGRWRQPLVILFASALVGTSESFPIF